MPPQPPRSGRFAPSPTGPLHAGSLVAALASWLDARSAGARWLVRIEDVDTPRCVKGMDLEILRQLAQLHLVSDAPVLYQSRRAAAYQAALDQLLACGAAFRCGCTRKDIEDRLASSGRLPERHAQAVYPGTCRDGLKGRPVRSVRLRTALAGGEDIVVDWSDRRLGRQRQSVTREVGDFVLHRADGLWAYQLAVVVDDAAQGITDVVRGEDLADNTARQILLQRALDLPTPRYLHTPLVVAADGQKLSKQTGATALDLHDPLTALHAAAEVLGLPRLQAKTVGDWVKTCMLPNMDK